MLRDTRVKSEVNVGELIRKQKSEMVVTPPAFASDRAIKGQLNPTVS